MARDLSFSICPHCRRGMLIKSGERTGGFSAGKAAMGAVLVCPLGLAAGALGKKKTTYVCDICKYTIEE